MAINSQKKGAEGERSFCKFLRSLDISASRTAQHCGKNGGEPDIKCDDLKDFHIEVKCSGVCDVYGYLDQAERDSGTDKFPVVAYKRQSKTHRGNRWVVILDARDWVILAKNMQKKGEDSAINMNNKNSLSDSCRDKDIPDTFDVESYDEMLNLLFPESI